MTPLEELRSIGSFSGAMFKVLEDFDARLKQVEAHVPMLNELKPHFEEQQRAMAEAANAEQPTSEPITEPVSASPSPEPTREHSSEPSQTEETALPGESQL